MNAFKTLLAAATLAAGVGAAPLLAQDPQNQQPSMSGEGLSRIQVEGKITDIDKGTNSIVVESRDIPGHTGAEMKLTYSVTDISLFDKFHDGDKVIADVIVTDKGPTVEAIHAPGETPVADPVTPAPAPAPDAVTPAPTTDAPATPDSDRDAMKGDKSGDVPATDSTANPKTDTDVRPDSTQPPSQVVPAPGSEPSTSAPTPPQ